MRVFELFDNDDDLISEIKQRLDPKCWKGKHKEGTKIKGGIRVNNCVPNESVELDRSKNPNYPNDSATRKHRLDTAKALLSDPKTDPDSRREAAAIVARMEKK
jgi:hypothetical protein